MKENCTGLVACIGDRNCVHIQDFEPEENRPLGRSRYRWQYNSSMDVEEIGWGGMDWINLSHDKMVGSYEHDSEPLGSKQLVEYSIN